MPIHGSTHVEFLRVDPPRLDHCAIPVAARKFRDGPDVSASPANFCAVTVTLTPHVFTGATALLVEPLRLTAPMDENPRTVKRATTPGCV